jgi:hypothetical protein
LNFDLRLGAELSQQDQFSYTNSDPEVFRCKLFFDEPRSGCVTWYLHRWINGNPSLMLRPDCLFQGCRISFLAIGVKRCTAAG